MNKFDFVPALVVAAASLQVSSVLWASVEGSLSPSGVKGPPSPPRNLRRSVVGTLGRSREYRIYWSASEDTGGLAVNYTVKLCPADFLTFNQSISKNNNCTFSKSSDCQALNVLRTNKNFMCNLKSELDFKFCGEFCNYTVCVVASNDIGSTKSCIPAPYIEANSVTPLPPLRFSVMVENGEITVRWEERSTWNVFDIVYTVLYHPLNQNTANKTREIVNKTTYLRLPGLEAFTTYCFYLMVQFVNGEGHRSAHSEVLERRCNKTPAGDPINPPEIVQDQSVVFPNNFKLRNVTVKWKPATDTSWRGTPHQYLISCDYHNLDEGPLTEKCEYHTDATTNSTVLQGLSTTKSYNVYIKMCNKENKCSSLGKSYLVRAQRGDPTQPLNQGQMSTKQIAVIVISVTGGFLIAAVAAFFTWKWRRDERRRGQIALQEQFGGLNNPDPHHEYDYVNDKVNGYAVVYDRANAGTEV